MVFITKSAFKENIEAWKKLLTTLNHRQSGIDSKVRDVNMFIKFIDLKNENEITGETLLDFIAWLKTERNNASGAINRKISSVKSYIRNLRLLQIKGAEAFPVKEVPRCREQYPGPIQALEPSEVQKILKGIDTTTVIGYRDYFLFSLMYNMGLRISEISGLNISDINLDKETITIHGKGNKKRVLPLVRQLITLLEKWLQLRKKMVNADSCDYLFISKKGNRLAIRTIQDNFKKYVTNVGKLSMEKVTPHSLRHAFATHALESESDLLVLKTILGHARLETTEIYLHPSINVMRKAVNDHLANDILGNLIGDKVYPVKINNRRIYKIKSAA